MSQLGERLRSARESQGVSLAQVAAETRILQRYLVALEDGDYLHLPGEVYARGFVRNYAHYLGLPVEELIELYRTERGVSEPIRVRPVTSAPRIRGIFIPSFFGVFFVVLTLIGLSYLALSAANRIGESAQATTPVITAAPPPPLPTAAAPRLNAPVLAGVATTTPPASTEGAGGVQRTAALTPSPEAPIVGEVRIAPDQRSWVNILADGESIYAGILGPNARRPFTAKRDIRVLIGNAGAVSIVVNGQEFVGLGGDGRVVTFTWPR